MLFCVCVAAQRHCFDRCTQLKLVSKNKEGQKEGDNFGGAPPESRDVCPQYQNTGATLSQGLRFELAWTLPFNY